MARSRLLVVDDDDSVAKLICRIAEKLDFRTEIADGLTAATYCERFDPDVIVLDICMPDIDGFEVLHHLAKYHNKASILILSAQPTALINMAEGMGRELGLRIVGTIAKPFTINGLEDMLQRVRHIQMLTRPHAKPIPRWFALSATQP